MDVVARFGGEEFCVLLPGISKQSALRVAERIREDIQRENLYSGKHFVGRLTASLGIASFPEDGSDATSVLYASDIAAYQAKRCGRNRAIAAGRADGRAAASSGNVPPPI
jgi:diguanylate cyclase (GGDEF)-like protein